MHGISPSELGKLSCGNLLNSPMTKGVWSSFVSQAVDDTESEGTMEEYEDFGSVRLPTASNSDGLFPSQASHHRTRKKKTLIRPFYIIPTHEQIIFPVRRKISQWLVPLLAPL